VSEEAVTRQGLSSHRPGREAVPEFSTSRRRRRGRRGEQPMVPKAEFRSYYGLPILNKPVWEPVDIAGYLFLGGLAGASSVVAAVADVQGRAELARVSKTGAAAAALLSLAALVHDLGKPARFLNMLRVVKPTSPMNIGSWLLSAYAPAAVVAAGSALAGRLRPLGAAGTAGAALLGPAVASYTAVLISDTAVPAWHDGYREMPFVFVGSAAMAAGGLGLVAAPAHEQGFPCRVALAGAVAELASAQLMEHRIGVAKESYEKGKGGALMKVGKGLAAGGCALALLGRRSRAVAGVGGALLLASSAATRFGIFHAGVASAEDPRHTVQPQRERLAHRAEHGNG
jgi:Polysulphide reductase, NrfD